MSVADLSSAGLVRVPEWAEWPWLRAGFSTRVGGLTSAYGTVGEQNLGFTKEDSAAVVAVNRKRFLRAVQGEDSLPLLTVGQTHSADVLVVDGAGDIAAKGLMTAEGKPALRGDGLLAREPGVMLGILTADCVPVLVADTRTRAVAAFHAGWRGTLARIVEQGVGKMLELGSRDEDLVAAIGPGISASCFEVGDEVRSAFAEEFRYGAELASGRRLDLIEANRRQLVAGGVGRVSVVGECTACSRLPDGRRKYFSYRAEQGVTGRMLSVIGALG